jgi:hypothetical protein
METLNMSRLEGYRTNGTLHIVLNNQIGFTTLPKDARSTRYATDVAKMLACPIFHVQGEAPEAAVHAVRLALEYRRAFGRDVVVELICYRRHGHNEGDEPAFTQPLMYSQIASRPGVNRIYADLQSSDWPRSSRPLSIGLNPLLQRSRNQGISASTTAGTGSLPNTWPPGSKPGCRLKSCCSSVVVWQKCRPVSAPTPKFRP